MNRIIFILPAWIAWTLAQASLAAGIAVSVSALHDPEFIEHRIDQLPMADRMTNDLTIMRGDPVSLVILVRNDGDGFSCPVLGSMDPCTANFSTTIVIRHPDGSVRRRGLNTNCGRFRPGDPRPLRPDESMSLQTWLFRGESARDREVPGGLRHTYEFEQEGEYELHVEFRTGHPDDYWRAQREGRDPPPLISSNRITVHVGPSFEGWEELKNAGILTAPELDDWPAAFRDPADTMTTGALVRRADRPWLTHWFETLRAKKIDRQQ